KNLVEKLTQEQFEQLLGDIDGVSPQEFLLANFPNMKHNFVEESLPIIRMILLDKMIYRQVEKLTNIPIATISRWFTKARETYIGYLDERWYANLYPELKWQGGNDPGLADFLDIENKIVISKKSRYNSRYRPSEKDLSQEEKELIKSGWKGFLVLTDLLGEELVTYKVKFDYPKQ
ncbi:MAG: hypothetical protein ACTSSK_12130, partial [Candidatus Heimdallarchaeota archaeon]